MKIKNTTHQNNSNIKIQNSKFKDSAIAVIGLGYVGLPLAVTFGKIIPTIGFDLNEAKIDQLNRHSDVTGEVSVSEFETAPTLH